jgi:MFS family permease
MRKSFKLYTIAWAVVLALFNLVSFIIPSIPEQTKFTPSFWIGYVFITITFIGQLVCAYIAFKAYTPKRVFYTLSLITTSYAGLIASFLLGGICMLLSFLPYWVGIIICSAVLVANIVAIVKSTALLEMHVELIDKQIQEKTFFIKSLTVDAETLVARAKSDAVKEECRKVYEAVRYSDPMTSEALVAIENEISKAFATLSDAVVADDVAAVTFAANEVIILIGNRNSKCKLFK